MLFASYRSWLKMSLNLTRVSLMRSARSLSMPLSCIRWFVLANMPGSLRLLKSVSWHTNWLNTLLSVLYACIVLSPSMLLCRLAKSSSGVLRYVLEDEGMGSGECVGISFNKNVPTRSESLLFGRHENICKN